MSKYEARNEETIMETAATRQQRINATRNNLIERGYRCLSAGKFGLPSYTDIEAWIHGERPGTVLYLIYDRKTGGWDILTPVATGNDIDSTWAAVDALDAAMTA